MTAQIRLHQASRFCERLSSVHSEGSVEAAFAEFLADPSVSEFRRLAGNGQRRSVALRRAFRAQLAPLYENARLWNHCLTKPCGYPGDYIALEHFYDQKPHDDTSGAWTFVDLWATKTTLARAFKARKDVLRAWIEEEAWGRERFRLCALGSGSARELREMPLDRLSGVSATLVDGDRKALWFARQHLEGRARSLGLVDDDVAREGDVPGALGGARFDVIYTAGMFDYMNDDAAVEVSRKFSQLLTEDGYFLFSLTDARRFDAWFYDLFLDWRWVKRTVDDGPALAHKMGLRVVRTLRVEGGSQGVFVCQKAPAHDEW